MVEDPLELFDTFAARVKERLQKGREEYGDRSFSKEPSELFGEINEELLDVMGWTFVLWLRLARIESIQRNELQKATTAGQTVSDQMKCDKEHKEDE